MAPSADKHPPDRLARVRALLPGRFAAVTARMSRDRRRIGLIVALASGITGLSAILGSGGLGPVWPLLAGVGVGSAVAAGLAFRAVGHEATDRAKRRWVVIAATVALLVGMTAYSRLDAFLRASHGPGQAAFGIEAATAIFQSPTDRRDSIAAAVTVWSAAAVTAAPAVDAAPSGDGAAPAPPRIVPIAAVLGWLAAADSLLIVPAYAVLLTCLVRGSGPLIAGEKESLTGTADADTIRRMGDLRRWAAMAIVLAAWSDWWENATALALLGAPLTPADPSGASLLPPAYAGPPLWACIVLSLFTWLKWVGLIAAMGYLALAALLVVQHGKEPGTTWRYAPDIAATAAALRIPLLAIVAIFVPLHVVDQGPDMIRRWADAPLTGVIGVAAALAFVAVAGLASRWSLDAAVARAVAPADASAVAVRRPWLFGAAALFAYAITASAFWVAVTPALPWRVVCLTILLGVLLALAWLGPWVWRGLQEDDRAPSRRATQVASGVAALLVQRLLAAKRDLRLPQALAQLDRIAFLVLDDIGYVQHDQDEMEVMFAVLADRYERKSVGISTNLVFSDWIQIFKSPLTTMAAIDRVVHHSVILDLMPVASYRAQAALGQQRQRSPFASALPT